MKLKYTLKQKVTNEFKYTFYFILQKCKFRIQGLSTYEYLLQESLNHYDIGVYLSEFMLTPVEPSCQSQSRAPCL